MFKRTSKTKFTTRIQTGNSGTKDLLERRRSVAKKLTLRKRSLIKTITNENKETETQDKIERNEKVEKSDRNN